MSKVSVIMSVYNGGNQSVLELCIDSIRSQSYSNFEMIICDDGSTDGTINILRELCEQDDRFKIIRSERNLTAGVARNRCLALATGEYVAVMDADDYCSPNRLEEQLAFLKHNQNIDFVGTTAELFDETGAWNIRSYKSLPSKKDFLFVLPFIHASVMFRRSALNRVSGYCEDRKVRRSEDYDLFMRLYAAGSIGANLDKVLYHVREDQDAFRRRKYIYRWNELVVRFRGFRKLGLLPAGLPYVVKPLIVGLIPLKLLLFLKDRYYKK